MIFLQSPVWVAEVLLRQEGRGGAGGEARQGARRQEEGSSRDISRGSLGKGLLDMFVVWDGLWRITAASLSLWFMAVPEAIWKDVEGS